MGAGLGLLGMGSVCRLRVQGVPRLCQQCAGVCTSRAVGHGYVRERVTTVCEGFVPRLCQPSTKRLVAVVEVRVCGSLRGRGMLAVCVWCVYPLCMLTGCGRVCSVPMAGWAEQNRGMWLVVGRGARAAA